MNIMLPFDNKAVHYQKKTKSSVGVHGAQTLIFNVVLCRSLGVLLSILSHMATESHASFCHHLASIVCRLLALNIVIFSEFALPNDPVNQFDNIVRYSFSFNIIVRSS
jgi:hypothetical protein